MLAPAASMTRSATSEGLRQSPQQPQPSQPRRPLTASPARETEYSRNFRAFDQYEYVDDVHGFRTRSPSASGRESASKTWLDQVSERHGQALAFAKRSLAGHPITGFESLARAYEDLRFPFPKDRELRALALAIPRDASRSRRSHSAAPSRHPPAPAAASAAAAAAAGQSLPRPV